VATKPVRSRAAAISHFGHVHNLLEPGDRPEAAKDGWAPRGLAISRGLGRSTGSQEMLHAAKMGKHQKCRVLHARARLPVQFDTRLEVLSRFSFPRSPYLAGFREAYFELGVCVWRGGQLSKAADLYPPPLVQPFAVTVLLLAFSPLPTS
jgi:hypothetical protein